MTELAAFIQGMPKAELHLHLEGTLEPELKFELAARNGVALPYRSAAEMRAAYDFDDLASFLAVYYEGMSVLRARAGLLRPRDWRTSARPRSQNVVYAEVFFDPQAHTIARRPVRDRDRGLPPGAAGRRGRARPAKPPDHVLPARPLRRVGARDARGVAALPGLDRRRRARLGRARQPARQVP